MDRTVLMGVLYSNSSKWLSTMDQKAGRYYSEDPEITRTDCAGESDMLSKKLSPVRTNPRGTTWRLELVLITQCR
jgi:hypothetical protein